jgi:hypothetical protein
MSQPCIKYIKNHLYRIGLATNNYTKVIFHENGGYEGIKGFFLYF